MSHDWLLDGAMKDRQSVTPKWQLIDQPLIDGVRMKDVKHVAKDGGYLTELFRRDWWDDMGEADQVFQNVMFPGAISAWHAHEFTTDRLFVTSGQMKVVLYDARRDSPTYGLLNKFNLGVANSALVIVPPRVWHGVQVLGSQTAILVNIVDRAYCYESPDHWRLPQHTSEIPYAFVSPQRIASDKSEDRRAVVAGPHFASSAPAESAHPCDGQ